MVSKEKKTRPGTVSLDFGELADSEIFDFFSKAKAMGSSQAPPETSRFRTAADSRLAAAGGTRGVLTTAATALDTLFSQSAQLRV